MTFASRSAFALVGLVLASEVFALEPFRIVALPDTQVYAFNTASNPAGPRIFEAQTNWIVQNRDALNIRFVTHVGDVVDGATTGQFEAANTAMNTLHGQVPYGILPGNHDYTRVGFKTDAGALNMYGQYFGPQRFTDVAYNPGSPISPTNFHGGFMPTNFGGLQSDINIGNSYQYFESQGMKFLHVSLEWQPDYPGNLGGGVLTNRKVLQWAASVIDAHPGVPTIITTHEDLRDADPNSGNGGTTIFGQHVFNTLIKPRDQVFMFLSGHNHFGQNNVVNGDGEWRRTDLNNAGNPVFRVMSTFQDWPLGGDGYLRLLTFHPDAARIDFQTYSPTRDAFLTDFIGPTASQFSYNLDLLGGRFPNIPEPTGLGLLLPAAAVLLRRRAN